MTTKNIVLGIDPGTKTGVATFVNGVLTLAQTYTHPALIQLLQGGLVNAVVYEDANLQKPVFARAGANARMMLKIAQNVGEVKFMCKEIARVCGEQNIPCLGVSPLAKGSKLGAEAFKKRTGFQPRTSQHGRDAAMVYFASSIGRFQGKDTFEVLNKL
jgi:hypothetical protein